MEEIKATAEEKLLSEDGTESAEDASEALPSDGGEMKAAQPEDVAEGDGEEAADGEDGYLPDDEGEQAEDAAASGADAEAKKAPTAKRYTSIPRHAHRPQIGMSGAELASAREMFSELSDREIYELYRKVTK